MGLDVTNYPWRQMTLLRTVWFITPGRVNDSNAGSMNGNLWIIYFVDDIMTFVMVAGGFPS